MAEIGGNYGLCDLETLGLILVEMERIKHRIRNFLVASSFLQNTPIHF